MYMCMYMYMYIYRDIDIDIDITKLIEFSVVVVLISSFCRFFYLEHLHVIQQNIATCIEKLNNHVIFPVQRLLGKY